MIKFLMRYWKSYKIKPVCGVTKICTGCVVKYLNPEYKSDHLLERCNFTYLHVLNCKYSDVLSWNLPLAFCVRISLIITKLSFFYLSRTYSLELPVTDHLWNKVFFFFSKTSQTRWYKDYLQISSFKNNVFKIL